jgi:RNA polymerase sigma-70 factor (ECF subfamily)
LPQADASFEAVVERHGPMVFRTLLRLTSDRENLEDLAQEVFLRLYRALPSFRGEALVSTYLYRIVVNVAQNEWKRRQREDRPRYSISDEEEGWSDRLRHPSRNAEEQMQDAEFAAMVDAELQKLSAIERSVLVLYHQEERSYEQIAQSLQMPIGTVRTHLHRGRKKLREGIRQRTAQEVAR